MTGDEILEGENIEIFIVSRRRRARMFVIRILISHRCTYITQLSALLN